MTAVLEIGIVAALVSGISALINKKLGNPQRVNEIKKQFSDFQKKYKAAKKGGDAELIKKLEEEQKEMTGLAKEMMVHSFKPMLYTFIPIIVVIGLVSAKYGGQSVVVAGISLHWIWWYFIVSLITGIAVEIIYRRVRKSGAKSIEEQKAA